MAKVLQKTAVNLREIHPPHRGILNPKDFYKHFQLRSFAPSPALRQCVAYFWTQRWDFAEETTYTPSLEIFTGPNGYLFFGQNDAFIHGICERGFDYGIEGRSGVIAGIKFKPGGLYPFWGQPMTTLVERKVPISHLFSEVTPAFTASLLAQDDEVIAVGLNRLLLDHAPKRHPHVTLVNEILHAIEEDSTLDTVRAVARRFHRSERSLQEIFQTYVGVGVKWALMRNRLLRATEYARKSPKPAWPEIAHELGYSSQPHFATDFKRATGQTPTRYTQILR